MSQTRTGTFTMDGVSTGITNLAGANFTDIYTEVAAGSSGIGNYTVFTVSGSSTYTLTAQGTYAEWEPQTLRAPLNGLQIVVVPEPSISLLGALALLPLLRRKR